MKNSPIFSGLQWSLVDKVVGIALQLLFTIVLARLLDPEAYGIIGTALIFISIGELFNEIGFSGLLIQKDSSTIEEKSTIFWFYIFSGSIWTVLLFFTSGFIGDYYNSSEIALCTKILSFTFLLNASIQVHEKLLIKSFNTKRIFQIRFFSILLSGTLGIVMTYWGMTYMALTLQYLSKSVFNFILFWLFSSWSPSFIFDYSYIKKNRKFGTNLMLINWVNYVARNIDKFLVSKLIGIRELGIYTKAFQFSKIPLTILFSLDGIIFSTFSYYKKENEKLQLLITNFTKIILQILFPLIVFIIINLELMVNIILGDQWSAIVWPLQMMLIGVSILSLNMVSNTFKPLNKLNIELKISLATRSLSILILVSSSFWGLEGIIYAYLLSCIINTGPKFITAMKLIDLNFKRFFNDLKFSILFSSLLLASFCILKFIFTNLISTTNYNWYILGLTTVVFLVALKINRGMSISTIKNLLK